MFARERTGVDLVLGIDVEAEAAKLVDIMGNSRGRPLDRRAGGLWTQEDALQSLGPLGQGGGLAAGVRGTGGHRRAARRADAGLDLGQGTPLGDGRKRGASANGIGRSRGGPTTKLHALVDGLGRLVAFVITPGQRGDAPAT